jgi:hypothetical protein
MHPPLPEGGADGGRHGGDVVSHRPRASAVGGGTAESRASDLAGGCGLPSQEQTREVVRPLLPVIPEQRSGPCRTARKRRGGGNGNDMVSRRARARPL